MSIQTNEDYTPLKKTEFFRLENPGPLPTIFMEYYFLFHSKFRIAVLGLDYHDMTRKTHVPLGVNHLYTRLLELKV